MPHSLYVGVSRKPASLGPTVSPPAILPVLPPAAAGPRLRNSGQRLPSAQSVANKSAVVKECSLQASPSAPAAGPPNLRHGLKASQINDHNLWHASA